MQPKQGKDMIFYVSMGLSLISILFYQIFQKEISATVHPVVSLIITYTVALLSSVLLLFVFPVAQKFPEAVREANYASYLLGLAVVGIEAGFLLVYRSGWKLGIASGFASAIATAVLVVVGMFFFKEQLSLVKLIGLVCCIAGIFLLQMD